MDRKMKYFLSFIFVLLLSACGGGDDYLHKLEVNTLATDVTKDYGAGFFCTKAIELSSKIPCREFVLSSAEEWKKFTCTYGNKDCALVQPDFSRNFVVGVAIYQGRNEEEVVNGCNAFLVQPKEILEFNDFIEIRYSRIPYCGGLYIQLPLNSSSNRWFYIPRTDKKIVFVTVP